MISTNAEPTTTPSATRAISLACSGVRTPKPTAIGRSVCCLMRLTFASFAAMRRTRRAARELAAAKATEDPKLALEHLHLASELAVRRAQQAEREEAEERRPLRGGGVALDGRLEVVPETLERLDAARLEREPLLVRRERRAAREELDTHFFRFDDARCVLVEGKRRGAARGEGQVRVEVGDAAALDFLESGASRVRDRVEELATRQFGRHQTSLDSDRLLVGGELHRREERRGHVPCLEPGPHQLHRRVARYRQELFVRERIRVEDTAAFVEGGVVFVQLPMELAAALAAARGLEALEPRRIVADDVAAQPV